MMKNAFLFHLKSFLFLICLIFSPDFLGHVEKRLVWKLKLNSEISDVINWEINTCNHILHNISRNKDNQTMKFGLLREFNIFFSKNHTQHVVNSVQDPLLKNQN